MVDAVVEDLSVSDVGACGACAFLNDGRAAEQFDAGGEIGVGVELAVAVLIEGGAGVVGGVEVGEEDIGVGEFESVFGWADGGFHGDHLVAVVDGVGEGGGGDVALACHANDHLGLSSGAGHGGQEDADEDGDNGDDDEEFDDGEGVDVFVRGHDRFPA